MASDFPGLAAIAAEHHGIVSRHDLLAHGYDTSATTKLERRGLISAVGPRSFLISGAPMTWRSQIAAGLADLDGRGFVAGRAGARLHGLDGFTADAIEFLVARPDRGRRTSGAVRSTSRPLSKRDTVTVDGLRCLSAERLILETPLFGFSVAEVENAIDSAIRLRLLSEQRLRTRVIAEHSQGINGSRTLLDAMVDTGGESRLERWFLRLVREAGLSRPRLQKTFRSGSRVIARVDALFGNLIVEVAGHGTHSSRRQIQADEQRRTELTLRGFTVITFTYDDVRDRPAWVVIQLRKALAGSQLGV